MFLIPCFLFAVCIAWTLRHLPDEQALGATDADKAKIREFLVFDVRANGQYCSWYLALIGVLASISVMDKAAFTAVLDLEHLWPFAVSLLAAALCTLFIPAGYGGTSFSNLRILWLRSIICEQAVVIFTAYGIWSVFGALI